MLKFFIWHIFLHCHVFEKLPEKWAARCYPKNTKKVLIGSTHRFLLDENEKLNFVCNAPILPFSFIRNMQAIIISCKPILGLFVCSG